MKRRENIMKNEFIVKINTIESAKKFCDVCSKFEPEIDLSGGRYIVNAKSIMGIFTLDLTQDLVATIHSSDADVLKRFNECMKDFEV